MTWGTVALCDFFFAMKRTTAVYRIWTFRTKDYTPNQLHKPNNNSLRYENLINAKILENRTIFTVQMLILWWCKKQDEEITKSGLWLTVGPQQFNIWKCKIWKTLKIHNPFIYFGISRSPIKQYDLVFPFHPPITARVRHKA